MKRKLFTLATIVICLSILAGGTFANFTAEGTAHNVITSGKVDVELLEWADDGMEKPFPDKPVPVMPGTEQTKIVEVKNVGTEPAYVRVLVEKEIRKDSSPTSLDTGVIGIDFDTVNWTKKTENDGTTYYYYKDVLGGGVTTEPLFNTVKFNGPDMGNDYQNSEAYVNVYVMAVQAKNNPVPDGGTVADVEGWPEPPQL